ncbi:hypothetical protein MWU78_02655 [Arenibacter sp. F26102]|uniref:hypothetical protein n=1 Tax=Arenibacter sp. F26102 TaxID=2926416 RepID=UPI001FF2A3DC|nr:hypothetical protein [Arenibacter sp. F26102]MCK0144542.1 hypothetical protein [Arenibacter sp. F26102]
MKLKTFLTFLILTATGCATAQTAENSNALNSSRPAMKELPMPTKSGKVFAPVVDIMPHLRGFHDYKKVREEMVFLKELGFKRVYFVLGQPGYSSFSDPTISVMSPDKGTGNHMLESILALGDPNFAYLYEAQRLGMEAWAIIKPYESGTGFTIPHDANAPLSRKQIETIGGQHINFDNLIADNPELRVKRKPEQDAILNRLNEPIKTLEVAFSLDSFRQKASSNTYFEFKGLKDSEIQIPEITLWHSQDNGKYVKYEGDIEVESKFEHRQVEDANGFLVSEKPKRLLVLTVKNFSLPEKHPYLAITFDQHKGLYTIPYSMIKAFTRSGEIPLTTGLHVRSPLSEAEGATSPKKREWGLENHTAKGEKAAKLFKDWGFEFEFQGAGFWGDGWVNSPVYGIAKGKRKYMGGTPCEAYPEVQKYWIDQVERVVKMGFDGIDFRLQNHSGMVSDYVNYGYNEPIIKRYKEKYGVDILKAEAEPLKIMEIRGEYFLSFLEKAADVLHSSGKKMQVSLRHAHEAPLLSDDFNELGFWAMPKILLDWKKAIDLADEVTIKHYYHGDYRPWMSDKIKTYASHQGKHVWVHNYFTQGDGVNYDFLNTIEEDERISGVLLYEVNRGLLYTGFPEQKWGQNVENINKLHNVLHKLNKN